MANIKDEKNIQNFKPSESSIYKKSLWFIGLWVLGVVTLAALAYSLRWAVNFAYMG
jgi:hypothetical protein